MMFPEDNKLNQTQKQMQKYLNGHQVWLSKASALWNARTTSVTRDMLIITREAKRPAALRGYWNSQCCFL